MPKIRIVNPSHEYRKMFDEKGFTVLERYEKEEPDLICFTGGSDVSPYLYHEEKHPRSFCDDIRDKQEVFIFEEAKEKGIPMVGICRGGQFLNVMNGGKMYQHVSNHTVSHVICDVLSKSEIVATSTHHQMMRPEKDAIIVATADQYGFKEYMDANGIVAHHGHEPDIEVLFYPATQSLCFQPHPEFGSARLQEYFFTLINRYINL